MIVYDWLWQIKTTHFEQNKFVKLLFLAELSLAKHCIPKIGYANPFPGFTFTS